MTRCPNHLNRRARFRGVCKLCYDALAKRVERGETWTALESQGLCLPQQPRGRPKKIMLPIR